MYVFNPTKNNYEYAPFFDVGIRCYQWALSRDFNHDGIADIITLDGTAPNAKVVIYEGKRDAVGGIVYDAIARGNFVGVADDTGSFVAPLTLPITSNLDAIDINADSHLDILLFDENEQKLKSLENLNKYYENYLLFRISSDCFGYFRKKSNENTIQLNTIEAACPENRTTTLVHGGSSISAADINCDNKPDLLIGDGLDGRLFLLTNTQQVADHWMTKMQSHYPDTAANNPSWASGYQIIDPITKRKELIVTNNNVRIGTTLGPVKKFINIGDECDPTFSLFSKEFLRDDMLCFGVGSRATFFDYNMDKLPDIVVGSHIIDNNGAI